MIRAMAFWVNLLILVLIIASTAGADPRLCRSPYAMASEHFNYGEYMKQTRDVGPYDFVWIWNSFGNKLQNPAGELQRSVVTGTEIILFNTVCVRNGNCGKYETLAGYRSNTLLAAIRADDAKLRGKLQAEAQRAAQWARASVPAGKRCLANPFLEHNMDRAAWAKATGWIAPYFAGVCDIVWNPMGGKPGAPQAPGSISEGHGDAPAFGGARCIANPDGTVIGASSYPSYLAKYGTQCDMACTWGPNDNCRSPSDKGFTDPRARPCKETGDFKLARAAMIGARKLAVAIPPWSPEDDKGKIGCTKMVDISDGAKVGFLWKQSDPAVLNRGAVTFLPKGYNGTRIDFKNVFVMKAGARISNSYERGVYHEDKSDRQFYRFHKLAVDFPFNVVVHYGHVCAAIPNPKVRND